MPETPADPLPEPDDDDMDFAEGEAAFDPDLLAQLPSTGILLPEELWSDHSRRPFDRCIDCERPLAGPGAPLHLLQKSLRDNECVFEFAICFDCARRNDGEMSEESHRRITAHFESRRRSVADLGACGLCGKVRALASGDFDLCGLARSDELVLPGFMVCGACVESIEALLSESTRRSMDDFVGRNFPGVPEGLLLPVGIL